MIDFDWLRRLFRPAPPPSPPAAQSLPAEIVDPLPPLHKQPIGIRQRNPGNLRPSGSQWQGLVGELGGYCVFDTFDNGIRAMALNLRNYQRKHGIDTIEAVIARYAPSSENDVEAYIAHVCKRTGYARAQVLDLSDRIVLGTLTRAMIRHECGLQPFAAAVILANVDKALAA